MAPGDRDYSTISPSAKSLLIMKSQTAIPYAREAAELIWGAEGVVGARASMNAEPLADLRRLHFEERYRSVDALLEEEQATRILEIAGGLSFRGLALASTRSEVSYLDTDLPEIAGIKADLVAKLHPGPLAGSLRVEPLDALDAGALSHAAASLPPGPLAIVNEGLLMYLGPDEKARLAASIRQTLLARGGAWITADVYVRRGSPSALRSERTQEFIKQHQVEENKFADWGEAESFFTRAGFFIRRRLSPSPDPGHIRESWVLDPAKA